MFYYKFSYLFELFIDIVCIIIVPLFVIEQWGGWNTIKNRFSKIVCKVMCIILFVIILVSDIIMIPKAVKYCMDIPAFITKNYDVTEGIISYKYESGSRPRYTVIVVNGIHLKGGINYKDKQYNYYKFYYLPNSNRIMKYDVCK